MNAAALGARRSLFGVRKEAAPNAERQTPNAKRRLRVLLVHNKLTRFVRIDRDLLWRRYDVDEFVVAGRWTSPWRGWRGRRPGGRLLFLVCPHQYPPPPPSSAGAGWAGGGGGGG